MRRRILIVEDDAQVRAFVVAALSSSGRDLELVEAANGRQAALAVEAQPIDLVLTDLQMPEMNGVELAKLLRDNYPEVKVVLMSGASSDWQAELERQQMLDLPLLPKPVSVAQLVETVLRILAS
jgi:CheY-like chemotaxis protein